MPFARYHIISQITGIIALTFAGLLTVSRHNIPYSAKLLFVLLFVTYPNFAFLQYFYFQSAYNFVGLLFVVMAYRIIESSKNVILLTVSIILLYIGITSYQSNFAVFLTVMMINIILDYMDDKNITNALKKIFKYSLYLIVTVVLYYISIKILSSNFNTHHTNFFAYKDGTILPHLKIVFMHIKDMLISRNYIGDHTANIIATFMLLILSLYLIIKSVKNKYYIFLLLFIILWILAMFSINILIGGVYDIRAEIPMAFYPSFIVLLFILFSKKIIKHNVYIFISIILSLCIIITHTYYIAKYQTSYVMNYNQDVITSTILMEYMYSKYPEIYNNKKKNYKLAVYGTLKKEVPPLMNTKYTFNVSFYNLHWGLDPYRIPAFLHLLGLPMHINATKITDEIKDIVKNMPLYPDKDCINLYNDTIIVKLSD